MLRCHEQVENPHNGRTKSYSKDPTKTIRNQKPTIYLTFLVQYDESPNPPIPIFWKRGVARTIIVHGSTTVLVSQTKSSSSYFSVPEPSFGVIRGLDFCGFFVDGWVVFCAKQEIFIPIASRFPEFQKI